MTKYPIDSIATVIRGVTFSKSEGTTSPSIDRLPIIRAGSIQKNLLLDKGQIWVPASKIKDHQLIRKNDIVMCTSSGSSNLVGKCAKSNQDWNGSFGAFCAGIRVDESKCDSSYLYHFLCSPLFRNWAKSSSGANIKNIRTSELASFEIPIPTLKEQKIIAEILDQADTIRCKRQQAIDLTDKIVHALFLDMFGDPVTNPKGWDTGDIKNYVAYDDRINYGVVQPGKDYEGGVPLIRAGDIKNMQVGLDNLKQIDPDIEKSYKRSRLHGDEILIACVGAIGDIAIVGDEHKNFNIARAVARVRFNKKVNRIFGAYMLSCPSILAYFIKETRTVAQPTLNIKQITETKIIIPPIEKQLMFTKKAMILKNVLATNMNSKAELNDLYNTLSIQAFRGELSIQTVAA